MSKSDRKDPLPDSIANHLARCLCDQNLVLFAGAGLSMQADSLDGCDRSMPSWDELLTDLATQFGEDRQDYEGRPLGLLDAIADAHGRPDLEVALRAAINDEAFQPSSIHRRLAGLPWSEILTTNYDTLLERSLNTAPVFRERHYDRLRNTPSPRLFKLHGDLSEPHTLTAADFMLWRTKHERAYKHVEGILLSKTILFVGYSLSDPHWSELISIVHQILGDRDRPLYGLFYKASDKALANLRRLHRINGVSLRSSADYLGAFEQLEGLLEGDLPPSKPVGGQHTMEHLRYEASVRSTYDHADLRGIYQWGAGFAREDVSLTDIFVPPDLILPKSIAIEDRPESAADTRKLTELQKERKKQEKLASAFESGQRRKARAALSERARLLIVGPPGQGKSTLLKYWLLERSQAWLAAPASEPLPVYIRLSTWQHEDGPSEAV